MLGQDIYHRGGAEKPNWPYRLSIEVMVNRPVDKYSLLVGAVLIICGGISLISSYAIRPTERRTSPADGDMYNVRINQKNKRKEGAMIMGGVRDYKHRIRIYKRDRRK